MLRLTVHTAGKCYSCCSWGHLFWLQETCICPEEGWGSSFPKRGGRLKILHVCFTEEHRFYIKASSKGGIFILDERWELWIVWGAQVSVSCLQKPVEHQRESIATIEVPVAAPNKRKSLGTFPGSTQQMSGLSQVRIRPLPLTIKLHHILLFATVQLHTDRHWKETVKRDVVMSHLANVCRGRKLYKCCTQF